MIFDLSLRKLVLIIVNIISSKGLSQCCYVKTCANADKKRLGRPSLEKSDPTRSVGSTILPKSGCLPRLLKRNVAMLTVDFLENL